MKKKLKIIGITPGSLEEVFKGWEYDYIINDLFSKFDVDLELIWENLNLFHENSLIIYSSDNRRLEDRIKNYFTEFKNKKIDFNLFHISNEQLNHECDYYDLSKNVFRNYYDYSINKKNVITLPLGYKGGFRNDSNVILTHEEKKYDVCFVGQLKNDRVELINEFSRFDKSFIHTINKWDCPSSISAENLKKIYSETLIVPCPMGNVNFDSFRICEVLESGSIPIIRKYDGIDYFRRIFGNHPIPEIEKWSQLSDIYKTIMNDPNKKILEINNWYNDFKESLRNKLYNLIS